MKIPMKKNFDVGLRIVIQKSSHSNENSNVVVFAKSTLKYNPQFTSKTCTPPRARSADYGFLKSCYLCNKKLRVDKDIYMYRGDQGFCSKECRSKQIEIDEKREIEASTKHTRASIRYHRTTARCDTQAHRDRKNGAIFL